MWDRMTTPLRFLSWTVIVIVAFAYVGFDAWRHGTPLELLMTIEDEVHTMPDPVPLSEVTEDQPEVPIRDEICFDASDTPHCVPVEDLGAARSVEEAPPRPRKIKRKHRQRANILTPARDDFKL